MRKTISKHVLVFASSIFLNTPILLAQHKTSEEHVVIDFEDPVLHDATWLGQQPNGTVETYIAPRGSADSGANTFRLAPGEGRNGSTALVVESTDATMGLPGFWVIRHRSSNGQPGNIGDDRGYFLPRGKKANRLEFWVRFNDGFRANHAKTAVQNLHIGTYHFDPGKIDGSRLVETDNWHFYHQLVLRHDQARDGWIHVVVNAQPQHQRSYGGGRPIDNPTAPAGNYWELLTRLYIDPVPYFSDPEIPYPFRMLVDDIKLSYVPELDPVEIKIENWMPSQEVDIPASTTNEFKVYLTNNSSGPITGTVALRTRYQITPSLIDPATQQSINEKVITLAAGEKRTLLLRLAPIAALEVGNRIAVGIIFVPTSEERPNNQSQNDPNVKLVQSTYGYSGPQDAAVSSTSLIAVIGPTSTNMRPRSHGGQIYRGPVNQTLRGSLPGHSPNNKPLNFTLVSQQSTGGVMTLNPNGSFQFIPAKDYAGSFFFKYKINDGVEDSQVFGSWIVVSENAPVPPAAPKNLRLTNSPL